jgi:hypothetical protein
MGGIVPDPLDLLRAAHASRESLFSVHYACQNFNQVKEGPASVACVSFYDVRDRSAYAFSLANVGDSTTTPAKREQILLLEALSFMREHAEARWLHWKMNRPEYGFSALEDRLRWLGEQSRGRPPADRCHDIEALVADRYGRNYASHPRLPNLLIRNAIATKHARWGAEEPGLVSKGDLMAVQQSATEKVRVLSEVFLLLINGRLQTDTSAGEVTFAGAHLDAVKVALSIADRFVLVQRALQRRHDHRHTLHVGDEYDTQDLFRALLVQFFDDVRDEEWTPSYAGGASRIDFLLPQTRLAIELKRTRPSLTQRALGEQLIVDRAKYKAHPDVGYLLCIVFDLDGHIANPRGVEQDLQEGTDEVVTTLVKIVDR